MRKFGTAVAATLAALLTAVDPAAAQTPAAPSSNATQKPNKVVGTWRPVSATVEVDGKTSYPYGKEPQGRLTFTSDLHFIEVLFDPAIPKIKSNQRGGGTEHATADHDDIPLWIGVHVRLVVTTELDNSAGGRRGCSTGSKTSRSLRAPNAVT